MAGTVADYFTTDASGGGSTSVSVEWTTNITVAGQRSGRTWTYAVQYHLVFDYQANATYLHLLVPALDEGVDVVQLCVGIAHRFQKTSLVGAPPPVTQNSINLRRNSADRPHPTEGMIYTRLIVLYIDASIDEATKALIYRQTDALGLLLKIRDRDYAIAVSKDDRPLAFISHDSRDKGTIARPLAAELARTLGRVWFDEFALRVGDPLRESIERGLKQCRRCVLVVSQHFLSNRGWAQAEFNSIFTRETIDKRPLFLPIWHDVTKQEVFDYCPSLADRLSVDWALGTEVVAAKITEAILGE